MRAMITGLQDTIDGLRSTIAELRATITELNARLGQDSSNSSKPPSGDGLKPAPKSLRAKTGRKPGGQPGHQGSTPRMVATPDQRIDHRPQECRACGHGLSGVGSTRAEARQVVDIPLVKPLVTEHLLHHVTCPACGADTVPDVPGATRQIQYGPNANALMAYLVTAQHLSVSRAAQLLAELMGMPVSTGTVQAAVAKAAARLAGFAAWVKQELRAAPVPHADETGLRVAGKLCRAHSASTPRATWIWVHPSRGRPGIDDAGVLPGCTGFLVSDMFSAYDTLPGLAGRQLCCAHLLRELRAVTDHHADANPGKGCWADQAAQAIRAAIADPASAPAAREQILDALRADEPHNHPGGKLGDKHAALARRLATRIDDYLRFTTTPGLEPTNNPAEQETRMVKIKMKITGGMRTLEGARHFTTIRSYLATARKNHQQALAAITSLFTSQNIWLPVTP